MTARCTGAVSSSIGSIRSRAASLRPSVDSAVVYAIQAGLENPAWQPEAHPYAAAAHFRA